MSNNIGKLGTESRNIRTMRLDKVNSIKMVNLIIEEEKRVVPAILKANKEIAKAADLYAQTIKNKGRIIVSGSGCSGDYAWTDVLELEATFGQKTEGYLNKDKVFGLHTQKGWYFNTKNYELAKKWYEDIKNRDQSEDSLLQVKKDFEEFNFSNKDCLIVISASGRSPALVASARWAQKKGGKVISIVMNQNTDIKKYSNITIEAIIGDPPLTGSGRTLAGTASKIIITTLSTAAHIKLGEVYSNLMVGLDVKNNLDNSKFVDRATRIVQTITKTQLDVSRKVLEKADWNIKAACIMIKKKVSYNEAMNLLKNNTLRKIIG